MVGGVTVFKIIFISVVCFIIAGCVNKEAEGIEDFKIQMISNNSDKHLSLNLKKCFFRGGVFENGFYKNVDLKFPLYTFSGNYSGSYECLKEKNELVSNLRISQLPSFNDVNKNNNEYWLKILNVNSENMLETEDGVSIYKYGVNTNVIVIDDSLNNNEGYIYIFYVKPAEYLDSKNGFTDRFRVESILEGDFMIRYDVYSSAFTSDNETIYGVDVNSTFVDDFRNIIQGRGDILDRRDVLLGFIENNKKVVSFIKNNSQEYSK